MMMMMMMIQGAVEVLGLVHEMLPPITTLVTRCHVMSDNTSLAAAADKTDNSDSSRRYYAIVESDHPYKPAAVHNYRVTTRFSSLTSHSTAMRCLTVVSFDLASSTTITGSFLSTRVVVSALFPRLA